VESKQCFQSWTDELVARYLTGRLSPEKAVLFELHYLTCEGCRGRLVSGQLLLTALADLDSVEESRDGRTVAAGESLLERGA
jgi:hypothetical protein